ncbi:type I restriction endonuclease subunit R [Thermomicrobium sp. 4228-Ro]|uniref:type I restriction endonuclease subunit R n=1 Tax=Thermomicrobium sp. 4228-Ro TaxID=2993937 RepID=UPI0022492F33|nr:type I restriction endonuclease subunit R [Thermomicrobium sp. 4228-Ro]MCX2728036.1 type I restriction endonuclease subunit R [Thermomicrobium sp. 4228-Ro]
MVLENLCALIERLRQRMQEYRGLLETSEAQTRVSLIDPLLQTLGWATDDPAAVQVEVRAGSGVADYVLRVDGQPVLVLEAKRLGQKLEIGHSAALSYAWELQRQGAAPRAVGVTDGCRWLLYDPRDLKQPRYAIDLADSKRTVPAIAVALAEALWRPLFLRETPSPPPPPPDSWRSLAGLRPKLGDPPPRCLRFPDGSERDLKTWKSLLVEVAEWLVTRGKLTSAVCPILLGPTRYLVHTEPRHPSGKNFLSGHALPNQLWVETSLSSEDIVRYTQKLLRQLGEDPSLFSLRL